jgi:hypothetical protein
MGWVRPPISLPGPLRPKGARGRHPSAQAPASAQKVRLISNEYIRPRAMFE